MTFGLQQILLWLAVSWDSLVPYAGLQAAAEGKFYNTNLNGTTNPSATSCLILYTFPWNTLYWWRNSFHAVLELHLDESGWTMLDVGGRNQDWLPAQEIHLEITTVSILRMSQLTAMQVILWICQWSDRINSCVFKMPITIRFSCSVTEFLQCYRIFETLYKTWELCMYKRTLYKWTLHHAFQDEPWRPNVCTIEN